MLQLYHYEPYANSMKCLICLEEKGLEFDARYIDLLAFEQHAPEFVALNPNGQVPVLIHDDAVITESTVINEYLEDAFPKTPLRPENPVERAQMRIWSKLVDDVLMPSVSWIGWHLRFHPFIKGLGREDFEGRVRSVPLKEMQDKWTKTYEDAFSEAELDESRRKIRWVVDKMESILARTPWLAGTRYSLADINTYPMLEGATRLTPEIANEEVAPRSMEWLARIGARPAVARAFGYSRFGNAPGNAADALSR